MLSMRDLLIICDCGFTISCIEMADWCVSIWLSTVMVAKRMRTIVRELFMLGWLRGLQRYLIFFFYCLHAHFVCCEWLEYSGFADAVNIIIVVVRGIIIDYSTCSPEWFRFSMWTIFRCTWNTEINRLIFEAVILFKGILVFLEMFAVIVYLLIVVVEDIVVDCLRSNREWVVNSFNLVVVVVVDVNRICWMIDCCVLRCLNGIRRWNWWSWEAICDCWVFRSEFRVDKIDEGRFFSVVSWINRLMWL